MSDIVPIPAAAIEEAIAIDVSRAATREPQRAITSWMDVVGEQQLDLPLSPQWSWITAKSGGLDPQFRALAVNHEAGSAGFAAFLDYTRSQYGIPLRIRELPGCQLVCYHAALVTAGDAEPLLDAVIALDGCACDVLHIPEVVCGGATAARVCDIARRRGWYVHRMPSTRSPFLAIDGSWEARLEAMSSSFRYTIRRKQRALARKGDITEEWFCSPGSVDRLFECMQRIEEASWKVEARMAISRSQRETEYYRLLLPWLAARGALQALVLAIDGEPAAYSLCYVWAGRMAQMKTSFSERFADASPGLVVTASTIRRAHELGMREFDFLGDVMPHKSQWTTLTRDHEHLYVYTGTLRSRIVGTLKRLRSAIRPPEPVVTIGRSGLATRQQTTDE